LFWWQAFLLLGVVALLWCQLPMTAVFYEPRVFTPLPSAHAAYVELDPAYAAQTVRRAVMAWTLGGAAGKRTAGSDFGLDELSDALQPPEFLDQGVRYPGVWRPAEVQPLAQRLGEVDAPSAVGAPKAAPLPAPPLGVRVVPDAALAEVGFTVVPQTAALSEGEGHGRFYVETGADGAVEHVLLFSPRTETVAAVERALMRGRATGAARGFVDVYWKFQK